MVIMNSFRETIYGLYNFVNWNCVVRNIEVNATYYNRILITLIYAFANQ